MKQTYNDQSRFAGLTILTVAALVLSTCLTSCGSSKMVLSDQTEAQVAHGPAVVPPPTIAEPVVPSTPDQLADQTWYLVWLKGTSVEKIDYRSGKPFAVFNIEKMTVLGNTGCNAFGGNIEINGDRIVTGMLFGTKKFCTGIPEPEFMRALEQCDRYAVKGNELKLYRADELFIIFNREM